MKLVASKDIDFCELQKASIFTWTLKDLLTLHSQIVKSTNATQSFRQHNVATSSAIGLVESYVDHRQVEKLMENIWPAFLHLLKNTKSYEDLAVALSFFWEAVVIRVHPFSDGNGRTAKFIINYVLSYLNLEVSNFYFIERGPPCPPGEDKFRHMKSYLITSFLVSIKTIVKNGEKKYA